MQQQTDVITMCWILHLWEHFSHLQNLAVCMKIMFGWHVESGKYLIQQQGWRNTQVWLEAICSELNQHPCWGGAILSTRRKAWSKDCSCQLTRLWQFHHESFVVFVILFVVKWVCSVSKNSLLQRLAWSTSNSKKIIAAEFCCCFWTWGKTGNWAPPIWCENSFPKSFFHHLQQNFIGGM